MNQTTQKIFSVLKKISLTREYEKAIVCEYHKDDIKTPMHMSWGEEAPTASVVEVLGARGQYFGAYLSSAAQLSWLDCGCSEAKF